MEITQVIQIRDDKDLLVLQVESETSPGSMYFCSYLKIENKWSCSCPDFQNRKKHEEHGKCKHIERAMDWIGSNRVKGQSVEEELNGMHDIVMDILEHDENARNNDLWLIMRVYEEKQAIKIYIPYDKVFNGELYAPETITRMRRQIQNEESLFPPTVERVKMKRKSAEHEFHDYYANSDEGKALAKDLMHRERLSELRD